MRNWYERGQFVGVDVMIWWRDNATQYLHCGSGGRDNRGVVALVVGWCDGRHRVGQRGDIRMRRERGGELGRVHWGMVQVVDDLHDDFSEGIEEIVDSGDGGAPGPKDGIAVGMLLVLGFGCANRSEEGAGRAYCAG
jgi:hypothetical protein